MEKGDPGRLRQRDHSSSGGAGRRAVTRSITRSGSRPEGEAAGNVDAKNIKGARNRLLDKLKTRCNDSEPPNSTSKYTASEEEDDGEEEDFCPFKFHGCSSSDAVQELVSTFNTKKLEILDKLGLSGLQYLKHGFHNSRHLVFWLLKRMDVENMNIKLVDGSFVKMNLESVRRILGIRCTGAQMMISSSKVTEYVKVRLHERFGTEESKDLPDLDDLRKVLCREYGNVMSEYDEETFMIAMAGYCCAYMFGPAKRSATVPRDIWNFIAYPKKLLNCNWGGYVLAVLQSSARAVQLNVRSNPSSIKLGGCWLYLQV